MVAGLIKKGEVAEIKETMRKSQSQGMQTFDQALYALHQHNLISYEEAIGQADSANDLRLEIKLRGKEEGIASLSSGTENLIIV